MQELYNNYFNIASKQIWKVAIYARLSREDEKDEKYKGQSESIENQIKYLKSIITTKGWVLVDIYKDDGYTGTNFDRPDFKRMLDDIDNGKINLVITKDLSRLLVDMLETSKYGLYHATNEGYCSWYEFANTIFKLANINIDIKAINSNEYASRAKRPLNSKLSKDKLIEYGFKPLPHWEDALKDYLIRRGDLLI